MLIVHIFIALSSVIFAGYTSFFPSNLKLRITYALVFLTLVTGTYLVVIKPVHIMSVCIDGLLYIGVVLVAIILAKRNLAARVQ